MQALSGLGKPALGVPPSQARSGLLQKPPSFNSRSQPQYDSNSNNYSNSGAERGGGGGGGGNAIISSGMLRDLAPPSQKPSLDMRSGLLGPGALSGPPPPPPQLQGRNRGDGSHDGGGA